MDGSWLLLFPAGALVASVVRHYRSPDARTRRDIRRARRGYVRYVRDGDVVRLTGTLRLLGEPLHGPLTGRPCAQFHARVTHVEAAGNTPELLVEQSQAVDFLLDDGSGTALIRMAGAVVAVTHDRHFRSGLGKAATLPLERFLARHGHDSQGLFFNKTLRYTEGALEPGERVSVLGLARWEPDPDPAARARAGYRDTPRRLVIVAPPGARLLVTDDEATAARPGEE